MRGGTVVGEAEAKLDGLAGECRQVDHRVQISLRIAAPRLFSGEDVVVASGDREVAVGETRYPLEGKRYANVYLLEFAADGRCCSFTEWYFRERS